MVEQRGHGARRTPGAADAAGRGTSAPPPEGRTGSGAAASTRSVLDAADAEGAASSGDADGEGTDAVPSGRPDSRGGVVPDRTAVSSGTAVSGGTVVSWRRAGRIAVAVALSVVAVLVVLALRDRAGAVAQLDVALPHVGWLLACVVANVVANAVLTDAWRVGVRLAGHDLSFAAAGRVWGVSQFSRFLFPGATVGARAGLGVRHGVPAGVGAATTLFEFALSLAVSPMLLLATLPWWLDELPAGLAWVPWTAAVPVVGLVALVAAPRASLDLLARALSGVPFLRDRAARGAAALAGVDLDRATSTGLVGRYLLNTALRLAGFLALVVGATGGGLDTDALLLAVGAYAVGRFVGRIAVFAPGGVGPREGATVVVLAQLVGVGGATLVVVVERLLELVAEVVLLGLCSLSLARQDR